MTSCSFRFSARCGFRAGATPSIWAPPGSGRCWAQAVDIYEDTRRRLAEELGLDPGPELSAAYAALLRDDAPASVAPVVPCQLPARPALFTGRSGELDRLTSALAEGDGAGTIAISAIGGVGGIGKTWLALHWAYQHLDRFPDGQLYVNLRGFDPAGEPVPSATAVRGFLDALGVHHAAIPIDLPAQVGLYRSLVAGKRMLIVLDNAAGTEQVTPLLPGGSTCAVLVTSRRYLGGLVTAHGARSLDLDVLPDEQARRLLGRHLGEDRLAAESVAAAELLAHCAGLPLAISVVAARAVGQPHLPLATLAAELSDHTAVLDALDTGDAPASLRAVFSWSYHALPGTAASVFAALGLAAGPDISLPGAASLTGLPAAQVRGALRELEQAHLVTQHAPGRFRMHDLVRRYAGECARREKPAGEISVALRRLVCFFLCTAYAAERSLDPHREPIDIGEPVAGCQPARLSGTAEAVAWLAAEHANLLAAQRLAAHNGWLNVVWQLAWTLDTFYRWRGYVHALEVWHAGLDAADRLDDTAAKTLAHQRLGNAYAAVGLVGEALEHLRQALAMAEHTGDLPGQAHAHHLLATVWEAKGDDRRALEHAVHGLDLFQRLGMPAWEGWALNQVGWHLARLGEHEQARAHCVAALALARRNGDREGIATTLDSLGFVAYHTGEHEQALDYYQEALGLMRELGHAYHEAETLERIGLAYQALGRPEPADEALRQALEGYEAQHRTADAARLRHQL